MRLRSTRRRRRQGFTIMEMMIVLVTIGIMAAMIAPALGEVVAGERAHSAAVDILRLSADMKSRTEALGVAHLMRYEKTANGLGLFRVFMGMNRRCTQTPWNQSFAASSDGEPLPRWTLSMADYNPGVSNPRDTDDGRQVITARGSVLASVPAGAQAAVDDPDRLDICYQPNGAHYVAINAAPTGLPALVQQRSGIVLTVRRSVDGQQHGTNREIYFPISGPARYR